MNISARKGDSKSPGRRPEPIKHASSRSSLLPRQLSNRAERILPRENSNVSLGRKPEPVLYDSKMPSIMPRQHSYKADRFLAHENSNVSLKYPLTLKSPEDIIQTAAISSRKNVTASTTYSVDIFLVKFIRIFRYWGKTITQKASPILDLTLFLGLTLFISISGHTFQDVYDSRQLAQTFINLLLNTRGVIDISQPNTSVKGFQNITSDEGFWDFLSTTLPDIIYPQVVFDKEEKGNIFRFNKIIQHIRLRQVRVRPMLCEIPSVIQRNYKRAVSNINSTLGQRVCYPAYSPDTEYQGMWQGLDYTSSTQLGLKERETFLNQYSYGGFVVALPKNNSLFKSNIAKLRSSRWTDEGTRAVFIDLAAFNPSQDTFVSMRLLMEFLPYGNVNPSGMIRAFRDQLTHEQPGTGTKAIVDLLAEIGLYLFGIANFLREVGKLRAYGFNGYIRGIWNIFTLATIGLLAMSAFFRFLVSRQWRDLEGANPTVGEWELDPLSNSWDIFWDWDFLGYCTSEIVKLEAIALVFAWMRCFGFLKFFSHRIDNFMSTLASAKGEIFISLNVVMLLILGFAIALHTGFGAQEAQFSSISVALTSLAQILFGNFSVSITSPDSGLMMDILLVIFSATLTLCSVSAVLSVLWWSSSRVLKGRIHRESDNRDENLKYRLMTILSAVLHYPILHRFVVPIIQLLNPPAHDNLGTTKHSDIKRTSRLLAKIIKAAEKLQDAVNRLQSNHTHLGIESSSGGLPLDIFLFSKIRNRFQEALFCNVLKAVRRSDADDLYEYLQMYKNNESLTNLDWRDANGMTALHIAATYDNSEVVLALLDAKVDANARNLDGNTSMHLASLKGHASVCEALIFEGGADLGVRNAEGFNALHCAAFAGHIEVVETLVEAENGLIFDLNNAGLSPLHLSTICGHDEIVEFLAERWPNSLSFQAAGGETALHFAVATKQPVEVIRMMLKMGAKVAIKSNDGMNAEDISLYYGAEPSTLRLLKRVLRMDDSFELATTSLVEGSATSDLIKCATNGTAQEMADLIFDGADINASNGAALSAAISARRLSAVRLLLDAGADPDLPDSSGCLPLLSVIRLGFYPGYLEIIELWKDAMPLPVDRHGNTLLHKAMEHGVKPSVAIIQHLVEVMLLDPTTRNVYGQTPLDMARDATGADLIRHSAEAAGSNSDAEDDHVARGAIAAYLAEPRAAILDSLPHDEDEDTFPKLPGQVEDAGEDNPD